LIFNTEWTESQIQQNTKEFINNYNEIQCYGSMNFNGAITLEFSIPIYHWLIFSKYKVPMTDEAYFSNYSARWHYEDDLKAIQEIKELMNFDQDSSN
jgi:hypothetical protein